MVGVCDFLQNIGMGFLDLVTDLGAEANLDAIQEAVRQNMIEQRRP